MSNAEVLSLVEQYKEAQQLMEAAQAEMETLKEQIKTEMAARRVDQLTAGTHKVSLSTFPTSRIDTKALKAAAPELAARFTRTTVGTRFVVA